MKAAEKAGSNSSVQRELDSLSSQLSAGNLNPGIGTKSLTGTGLSSARGANGARVFFRTVDGGVQIMAKASKANESDVISRLQSTYGVESYRVGKQGVRIEFLLGDGEDPDSVENTDAVIEMPDGRRWGATLITVRDVERILARWKSSGEAAGGLYFRVPDLVLMAEPGLEQMAAANC